MKLSILLDGRPNEKDIKNYKESSTLANIEKFQILKILQIS